MSRNVDFTITAHNKAALASLDSFLKKLNIIGKHQAFKKMNEHLTRQRRQWVQVRNHIRDAKRDYDKLAAAAKRWSKATEGVKNVNAKLTVNLKNTQKATDKIAQSAEKVNRSWEGVRRTLSHVAKMAGQMAKFGGRGLASGTAAIRGGATSIAGSVQGLGISTRMSGIAMAQQLGQIMAGPLSGNIMSGVIKGIRGVLNIGSGIVTVALELGIRIASGIAGGIVKAGGLVIGGAINTVMSTLAGVLSVANGPLALVVNSVGMALNNVVASLATVAGEMVGQIGNVLTGLGEMFRGAFQAAVNIASGVLNGLLTVAQGVVERVGGIMGKLGTMVMGVAGTIGGFAMRDIIKGGDTLTRGFVLLGPDVTPEQKDAARAWVFNMRRELGNITAGDPGKALERSISTGFQDDLVGAMDFAGGALRLSSLVGDEDAGVISRAGAKAWNIYKDELIKQAGSTGGGMDLLWDKMFAVKNFGDLDLGDLAIRLGDVSGVAKSMGMTFDDMLTTISQLSLVLGKEQTFTAFGRMMTTFVKISPQGVGQLARAGIGTRLHGPADKARIKALNEERDSLLNQSVAYKKLGNMLKEARVRKKELKNAGKDETKINDTITKLTRAKWEQEQKMDKGRIKSLADEITRIEMTEGKLRPLLDLWVDISKALEDGRLNMAKLSAAMPNVRAVKGMLGLTEMNKLEDGALSAQVKAGIGDAGGTVAAGQVVRQDDFGTKLLKGLAEIKQPYIQFWLTNREVINEFTDGAIAKLREFNDWWKSALNDPGALKFAENLGGKLKAAFSWMEVGAIDPATFWAAMNDGLDRTWEIGQAIVDVFKNIIKLIQQGATALGGWNNIWGNIKDAASTAADFLSQIANGDFSTITGAFEKVKGIVDAMVENFTLKIDTLMTKANRIFNDVKAKGGQALDEGLTAGKGGLFGLAAFQLMRGMGRGRAAAGAVGTATGGVTAAGGAASLGSKALAKGGGVLKGLGRAFAPLAAALTVYEMFQILDRDKAPTGRKGTGDSALGIGGAALTGAAIAGPYGALAGLVAGLALDLYDRSTRDDARRSMNAAAITRFNSMAGLQDGFIDERKKGSPATPFSSLSGPQGDITRKFGMLIREAQLTSRDTDRPANERLAAQGVVNEGFARMDAALAKYATDYNAASSKAGLESFTQGAIDPLVTEISGLAAQFPNDTLLASLRDEVKRLRDAVAAGGGGALAGRHMDRLQGTARRRGDALTAHSNQTSQGSTALAGFQGGKLSPKQLIAMRKRGTLLKGSVNIPGAFRLREDDLAQLPPDVQKTMVKLMNNNALNAQTFTQALTGEGGGGVFSSRTLTVPTNRAAFASGGFKDPAGKSNSGPGKSNGQTDQITSRFQYDAQGFAHLIKKLNGSTIFNHAFSRNVKNDPFSQGPMANGTYGFGAGSLGTPIGPQTTLGGLGGGFMADGSGGTRRFQNRSQFGVRTGKIQSGLHAPQGATAAQSQQSAIAEKLRSAAAAIEEAAKKAKTPQAAMELKKAAMAMKARANDLAKTSKQAGEKLVEGTKKMGDAVNGMAEAANAATAVQVEMNAKLLEKISAMEEKISQLEAQLNEGNG